MSQDSKDGVVALHSGEPRKGHPKENEGAPGSLKENGQHDDYWVLSEEEINKGLVRPVRDSYIHVGERPKYPTRPLTEEEKERFDGLGYVAYEKYPEGGSSVGMYWTQKRLNSGCGTKTTMSRSIAETYARRPSFYGSTFCCGCKTHLPVAEFVWDGTSERVGS